MARKVGHQALTSLPQWRPHVREGVVAVMPDPMVDLLGELVACPAPPGDEGAIDAIITREMQATGVEVTRDAADNLHARVPGAGPTVMVCAHKDEIGMLVTDVRPD
ncbi:hypothetical protein HN937_06730, partial [Candidatus Poribacteria bacterium]|nr:hypothetical protein [Candidatus Poribacteria bacterium]